MVEGARRLIRASKSLARDGHIPKLLRGLAAFGLLPIPGPFDEIALLIVGLLMWAFYRDRVREAWLGAADPDVTKGLLGGSEHEGHASAASSTRRGSS
jgi:hypothetical protein